MLRFLFQSLNQSDKICYKGFMRIHASEALSNIGLPAHKFIRLPQVGNLVAEGPIL